MLNRHSKHLVAVQGSREEHSETYTRYGERALERLTQQCAKTINGVLSSAQKYADRVMVCL